MRSNARWVASLLAWVAVLGGLELWARAVLRQAPPDAVQRIMEAERLAEPKRPGEVRLFLFGGSTMNGAHFNAYSSPQIWLRLLLHDLCDDPSAWRVINFARDGRGTDEIVARMRRILPYEPDAFFIYAAHNEGLAVNSRKLEPIDAVKDFFRRSQFIQLAEAWLERRRDQLRALRKQVRSQVGAGRVGMVKQPTSLDLVPPGSEKKRRIEENCRRNLRTMYELARTHNTACLLSTFVSNEVDFPPARSQHTEGLEAAARQEWESLTRAAQERLAAKRWAQAIPLLAKARALDPVYAQTAFDLGTCYRQTGRYDEAQEQFADAIELDALPNRDSPRLNEYVQDVARDYGMPVVEFRKRFQQLASHGLIGHNLIVDNCHLDVRGHYLLARTFLETLAKLQPFASRTLHWERLKSFEAYERGLNATDAERAETYRHIGTYVGSHFDWAIDAYQQALAYQPHDAGTEQLLILAYYQARRQAELREAMAQMEREHPADFAQMLTAYPELAGVSSR